MMLNPDGGFYHSDLSEGATMTMPRRLPFRHIGGPYDDAMIPVEVDADGVPPESYIFHDITDVDMSRSPISEVNVDQLHSLYERDEILGNDGFEYVFRFRGQDVIETNQRKAA